MTRVHRALIVLVACSGVILAFANSSVSSAKGSPGPGNLIYGRAATVAASVASIPQTKIIPIAGKPGHFHIQGCVSAPKNSKPWTFSDAQLNLYGLPLPEWYPLGRKDPHWLPWVSKPQTRDCDVAATNTTITPPSTPKTTGPANPIQDGWDYSNYWAGYTNSYNVADTFTIEQGDFEVPDIISSNNAGDALWSGLGGVGNCHLTQSAVIGIYSLTFQVKANAMAVENFGNTPSCDALWNPNYLHQAYVDTDFPVPDHAHVYTSVACNSMYVDDQTDNRTFSMAFGPCGQETHFDCILERLDGYYLPNNDESVFNNCMGYDQYGGGNWYDMGQTPSNFHQQNYNMTNDGTPTGELCTYLSTLNGSGGFSITTVTACTTASHYSSSPPTLDPMINTWVP